MGNNTLFSPQTFLGALTIAVLGGVIVGALEGRFDWLSLWKETEPETKKVQGGDAPRESVEAEPPEIVQDPISIEPAPEVSDQPEAGAAPTLDPELPAIDYRFEISEGADPTPESERQQPERRAPTRLYTNPLWDGNIQINFMEGTEYSAQQLRNHLSDHGFRVQLHRATLGRANRYPSQCILYPEGEESRARAVQEALREFGRFRLIAAEDESGIEIWVP